MKYLVMCEGPNELEIIRMLLEHDKLIFTEDDRLIIFLYATHFTQIAQLMYAHLHKRYPWKKSQSLQVEIMESARQLRLLLQNRELL